VPDGLSTGISVLPVHSDIAVSPTYLRSPLELALSGGTLTQLSGGRFVLGIGTGGLYRNEVRQALGHGQISALGVMRDYLTTLRPLLAGEAVTYEGSALRLRGARLAMRPPPHTPVYLAALGPEMLRLAGELADGVALNWCSPEQTAWSRLRIAEGAARAGRDPAAVRVIDYIRVCVDDDVDVARRAFTRMVMRYALGPRGPRARERALGYRGHFERMGFAGALAELDRMRERAASVEALVDAFPTDLLDRVGYYGPAAGAAETVRRIAGGLDTAIVRVVAARPGMDAVLAVMHACQPRLVQAAAA
jgi:alkanesulfonate monooxygenase SsuD/methylene tetrahydromethanopterin reductase-like flavin-dependent oxidoreductase (luciferase family)